MRLRLFQIAILLFASVAAAEDEPWNADPIDPTAIAEVRKALEKELKKPAKDAPEDEQTRYKARERRIAALRELESTARDYNSVPTTEESEAEQQRLEKQLATLRKQPAAPLPELREAKDITPLEDGAREAKTAAKAAQKELEDLQASSKDVEKALQAGVARAPELKRQVEQAAAKDAGSLQAYRGVTAQIELRRLDLYSKFSSTWRRRYDAAIQRAQVNVDLTREQASRVDKQLAAAREVLQKISQQKAKEKQDEAERLAEQAKLEKDPLYKFLTETKSEVTGIRGQIEGGDAEEHTKLKQKRNAEKTSLGLYQREYDRVQSRADTRRSMASETAKMLHSTLIRVKQWRREVVEQSRPRVDSRIAEVLAEISPLQDRYWALELPPQELAPWQELSAKLPPERQESALKEFTNAIVAKDGLRNALRDRIQALESTHELLNEIDSVYEAQVQALLKLDTFITGRIYWVQTDPRLGRHVVSESGGNLRRLWNFYAEPEFRAEFHAKIAARPYAYGTSLLLLVALLVGTTLGARRIRARPMHEPAESEHLRQGVGDALRVLMHAAAPSVVLLLGAAVINRLDLPSRVSFPLQTGFEVVALLLFIQRLAWGLLNKGGYLIVHFGVGPDVGSQILRSVRLYTLAGMVLWVPYHILQEAPVDVSALTRLFGTGFRTCELVAVAMLLPRRMPVAKAFVAGSEGGLRVLGMLNPLIFLGLGLIVLMDLLGYRYGAIFFSNQVMESALVVLILRALYSGLNQISVRVTARVRERAFREQGGSAAWEDSSTVTKQLTRLITVGTIVAAAVFLARSWAFGETYGRVFEEWKLSEVSDGVYLTAADVISAIVSIVAAHFLASNIAGIFELIVFPIFGKVHRGTRFVVLALSRYLILIIGYSAALISVHFSVANLGWLFAAVSVGLGFGLQEIVANFVSGLILLVEQPVRVGDVISVGETGGTIDKITIRSTVVNDWDQKQIIIPNKAFITQNVINWTRNNNFTRRKLPVNVAYGSDVETVLKVLDETVKGVENVRSYPPPRIWFDGFGDYALQFMVWIYVDIDYGFGTMSNARQAIYAALREAGITIPFPQSEVRLKPDGIEDLQGAAGLNEEPDAERPAPDA